MILRVAKFTKFNSQVPESVQARFSQIGHGQKQIACTAALIWYLNADERVQRLYREWARAIGEGHATIEEPPDTVAAVFARDTQNAGRSRKQTKR